MLNDHSFKGKGKLDIFARRTRKDEIFVKIKIEQRKKKQVKQTRKQFNRDFRDNKTRQDTNRQDKNGKNGAFGDEIKSKSK